MNKKAFMALSLDAKRDLRQKGERAKRVRLAIEGRRLRREQLVAFVSEWATDGNPAGHFGWRLECGEIKGVQRGRLTTTKE